MIKVADIAIAIEESAPLTLQESWDNSGWQLVVDPDAECRGVLTCVDITPDVIREAVGRGANVIASHHPLLFKGVKKIDATTNVGECILEAIKTGVSLYSSHTPLDKATGGINTTLAEALELSEIEPLTDSGIGVVGMLPQALTAQLLCEKVKEALGADRLRISSQPDGPITRLAICSGAGGSLIADALEKGADAMLTSDVRHHDFVDYGNRIFIIDTTHFESEECSKRLLANMLREKFAGLPISESETNLNPIKYI